MKGHLGTLGMLVAGVAAAALAAPATPAYASCMLPPWVSTHPFTGTVISVSNDGRTAGVRTDDGRIVTVNGSEADQPGAVTTVDRTYQAGVRYEFHPLNDTDPYRDNACTATHPIVATASSGPASSAAPPAVRKDASRGPGAGWTVGGIGGAAIAATIGGWLLLRRRTQPTPPGDGAEVQTGL